MKGTAMSKGYTINYFITVLKNTNTSLVNKNGLYNTVSPRYGYHSVKAEALDNWLNGLTAPIYRGDGRFASYGKTGRARVLKALQNRKTLGFV